ncbi:MAG: hypothetical protein K9K67_09930 [Bacteriovoracaceae bacterium]|nr:hypothetical protein [Bacteriovoracaceae bacterium]
MFGGSSKIFLIFLITLGVFISVWINFNSKGGVLHLTISNEDINFPIEETLIALYNKKGNENGFRPIDSDELPEKIRVILLDYKGKSGKIKNDPSDTHQLLNLVASIPSPIVEGHRLQASDIKIVPSKLLSKFSVTRIYIAYNMVGPKTLGALQVISLSEDINGRDYPTQLTLNQTVLFKDSEVHGLTIENDQLFLAGATNHKAFMTPAMLEVFKLNEGRVISKDSFRIDLPSYAATSVIFAHKDLYISTGDDRGGIIQMPLPRRVDKKILSLNELDHQIYDLQDPRDLAFNSHSVYAVSGGSASLWVKKKHSKDTPEVIPLRGGNLPEAKSSIEVTNSQAFLGLGDGGTKILSLKNFSLVGEIPQREDDQLDSTLTVTNAVGISDDEIFTADGEAGSRVFSMSNKGTIEQLANINFGPGISVNSVQKVGNYVVFATGLGGVKIAHLTARKEVKAKIPDQAREQDKSWQK